MLQLVMKNSTLNFLFIILTLNSFSQNIINTSNFTTRQFKTLSINLEDSSIIKVDSNKILSLINDGKSTELKGNIAILGPENIYSLSRGEKSVLYKFSKSGELLRKKKLKKKFIDICFYQDAIFALSGNSSKVFKFDNQFKQITYWESGIEFNNALNISISNNKSKFVIGAGLQPRELSFKGEIKEIKTGHACYSSTLDGSKYSLLHKYSDGSKLEIYKSDSVKLSITKEYDYDIKISPTTYTSIAIFTCWDLNKNGDSIITLDRTNTISLYNNFGKLIGEMKPSEKIEFIFFIKDTPYYLNSQNKITQITF